MKKIISLGIIVSTLALIVGCGAKVNLSFDDTYHVFSQNLFVGDLFEQSKMMMEKDYLGEHMEIAVKGDNDTALDMSLVMDSESDIKNMNSQSDMKVDFSFLDQATDNTIEGSGDIIMSFVNKGLFVNLKGFGLQMGEGNAEGQLFSLILKNFVDKWVKIDHPEMDATAKLTTQDILKIYNLPTILSQSLSGNMIFEDKGQQEYDGSQAYKVVENQVNMQAVLDDLSSEFQNFFPVMMTGESDISIKTGSFEGYLVARSNDEVDLMIANLEIVGADQAQNMLLTGTIGNGSFDLYVTDMNTQQTVHMLIKSFKKRTTILFEMMGALDENISIDLNLIPSGDAEAMNFDIDGKVQIEQYANAQAPEKMVFTINGTYNISEIEPVSFAEPATYLLLSQIFGDEYFMQGLIDQDSPVEIETGLSVEE